MNKPTGTSSSLGDLESRKAYVVGPVNTTLGSRPAKAYVVSAVGSNLTRRPRALLTDLGDTDAARLAEVLISSIEEAATGLQERGMDARVIPPAKAALIEGGGILLEWTSKSYRLGFAIESHPLTAGWYSIATSDKGETSSSGPLDENDVDAVARRFVEFMVRNS